MSGLSVQNLSEMRTKLKAWADRGDISDSVFNDFINISIEKANRFLRLEERVVESSRPVVDGNFSLPDDYMETKNLYVTVGDETLALERKTDAFVQANQSVPYGYSLVYPRWFAREGSTINIAPSSSSVENVRLTYWPTLEALTTDTSTNWMITDASVAVLYGALSEVGNYIMDEDMVAKWDSKFAMELQSIQEQSDKEKWSGNTLAVSP